MKIVKDIEKIIGRKQIKNLKKELLELNNAYSGNKIPVGKRILPKTPRNIVEKIVSDFEKGLFKVYFPTPKTSNIPSGTSPLLYKSSLTSKNVL